MRATKNLLKLQRYKFCSSYARLLKNSHSTVPTPFIKQLRVPRVVVSAEDGAVADLPGRRDSHLERMPDGLVIRLGVFGALRVSRKGFPHPHSAVGDGDEDLFAASPGAADDVVVRLNGGECSEAIL